MSHSKSQEIFTVIADAKIRELRESMAAKEDTSGHSRIIHCSDGTINLDELEDDDEETKEMGPVVDPKTLTWAPWAWYQALNVGGKVLKVCDFLGEHLADFFGITTPKYQLEIDERLAMIEEEKAEQLQAMEDHRHWAGRSEPLIELGPRLDAGDLSHDVDNQLEIVSEQPSTAALGQGDAPLMHSK
ncbi:protein FAM177B-like [Paramacrobiotus metropolitanus]|uniref:protein FAM177B-like n=1 Tax=Paramacrobiotus metropolitanus TaxID=2943436 RepID=UPI002445B009|nr:protein FAM177B-like [Paramacrobiotus metropolitanus]